MGDNLMNAYNWFHNFFSREWAVFFTAWLPFIELRGAIPLAISLDIQPFKAFWLGVTGNLMPILPILFFLNPLKDVLIKHSKLMERFFNWLYVRTIDKSNKVEKYGAIGLILFTAIPLPTTGAWTASLAAIIFDIKFKYAFPAIALGVLIAGLIVTLTSMVLF
jgi:uncharacterized membrane protein